MICCKRCSSGNHIKSGHIRNLQRYKCCDCGCQFTQTSRRGVHPLLRQLSIILYAHCGVSMSGIAKLFKVSVVAVLKWIRAASNKIPPRPSSGDHEVVQVDEMWHFVNGKKTKLGSGERWMGYHVRLLPGTSVIVLTSA